MSRFQIIVLAILSIVACTVIAGVGVAVIFLISPSQPRQAVQVAPTPTPRVMYFCGIDRCRQSGEYGKMVFRTGINVWNNPDPNRGGVHHRVSHGDVAIITAENRVEDFPGGLWYKLEGGGWTNDLWLTDAVCTPENISEYAQDC